MVADHKSATNNETRSPSSTGVQPVIKGVSLCLAHVPDLVRYGSKPSREIAKQDALLDQLEAHRRNYEQAVTYPPNQVFIGNISPEQLWEYPSPWFENPIEEASGCGPFGEILPQDQFYALMKACDDFDLLWLEEEFVSGVHEADDRHLLAQPEDLPALGEGRSAEEIQAKIDVGAAIPIYHQGNLVGCLLHGHEEDTDLRAGVLLENLAAKASAVLALRQAIFTTESVAASEIQYLIGCGEEAVGDRYQRGGGNLAKAVGEKAGCINATGSDVKAFCSAPNHAIIIGAALIKSGLFSHVAIVGGGVLAKLGMKHRGQLVHEMPILEDVLACTTILLGKDDGVSPVVDLECVGRHTIAAKASQQAIAEAIVVNPLARCGLKLTDVDRYATELHNPEVTEPQGSGNVPRTNYRILAALAAQRGEIAPGEIDAFVRQRGMPGFSPTQGHNASAVPYLGHACRELISGKIERAFFYSKGSLFLGRMTKLSDGISFLLKRNPALTES